jgi:hypothetical protein
MERREVVNASKENDRLDEWAFDAGAPSAIPVPPDLPFPGPDFPPTQAPTPQPGSSPARFGASSTARPICLYFGPAGERCYRPALNNGFCSRHQPDPSSTVLRDEARARTKKAAATVGILAALWPIIEELLRQLFRLLR